MNERYIDFHTHTILSDGDYSPMEVCRMAEQAGVSILAITDHNHTEDLTALQNAFPKIRFIQGAEVSCMYTDGNGKETELHVIALGFDRNNPKMQEILAHNHPDRRPYINAILDRLRLCGIDLGDYDTLRSQYPDRGHIGRMHIAKMMVERGYVSSISEAFDEYFGGHGKRRAYVPNRLRYVSLEEAVSAIVDAGGVAVLAHLYYYLLSDEENARLLRYFKSLTGKNGGLEVYYYCYDHPTRMTLKDLADEYDLMYSAASDFHGQNQNDTLANGFKASDCQALVEFLLR